ncbi:MAG: hypothetical protein ABI600_19820 [Luteolibacter sp.]
MKPIQLLHPPRWLTLMVTLLVTVWCVNADAAYWNKNQSHTHVQGGDLDGDGIPNIVDPDIDNDGIPNALDRNIDGGIARSGPYKDTYIGDHTDNDSPSEEDIDDDGLADDSLAEKDIDGDGKLNTDASEDDIDGDGKADDSAAERDIDGDGRNDDAANEDDIDGDGLDNDDAMEQDIDGDGKSDSVDDDIDGDGRLNGDAAETDIDADHLRNDDAAEKDEDGDGVDDVDDDDDNNDGTRDIDDSSLYPEEGEEEIEAYLAAQPAAPSGSTVKITLQHFGTGSAKFNVDARNLIVGSYDLFVGGVQHSSIAVVQLSSQTRGTITFKTSDSSSGDLLLDFPVAGQTIEIRQGGTIFFSNTAPALPVIGSGSTGYKKISLTRGPVISNQSEAEVKLYFGINGPTRLEVTMEKVPIGDYSVIIGAGNRGTLHVAGTAPETQGELVFNLAGSSGALLLNFPSAGQSISLIQGSTTYFFGQLPASAAP